MSRPGIFLAAGSPGSENALPVTMTQLGGRVYPLFTEPRCKTCRSPYRNTVEQYLLKSYAYKQIARDLPEDSNLSWQNIQTHFDKGHMPLEQTVHRVLIEERARELGRDIEGYQSTLADHITFARLAMQKGIQKLMDGKMEPDLDQTIAIANFLHKVEQMGGGDYDQEALADAFFVYWTAVEQHTSSDQQAAIGRAIDANPIMRSLMARTAAQRGMEIEGESEEMEDETPALGVPD